MRKGSLLVKFAVLFVVFSFVTLTMCGIGTYYNQRTIQYENYEQKSQAVNEYILNFMRQEGDEFLNYQKYTLANPDKIKIPYDFDNYIPAKKEFEKLFAAAYPGMVLGEDIGFDELNDELKIAYCIYKHEYWLSVCEKAVEYFGVQYVYYVVPTGESHHMYYFLDAVREKRVVDGKEYIELCLDVEQPMERHPTMWEAWDTGDTPKGNDLFDNEFGRTYAYYAPLIINNEKLGVIGSEALIENVDRSIIDSTLTQMFSIAIVILIGVATLLYYIHNRYIKKLEHLTGNVQNYTNEKDVDVVVSIEKEIKGADEIAALSNQIASMILELDSYMQSLVETTKELTDTKKKAEQMSEMAHRDALTGIRNKAAYDREVKKLDLKIEDGFREFGIAMIDLNFLKKTNDTYGHDKGNIAIKKLCNVVCNEFKHSPVFRIGGDEFVVIVINDDYENIESIVDSFNRRLDEIALEPGIDKWERVSASIGYAKFDYKIDNTVANVFKRADKAMYIRKKEMKAVRSN